VRLGAPGVDFQHGIEIGNCKSELAHLEIGRASIVPGISVVRVDRERLRIIVDGGIGISEGMSRIRAIVERQRYLVVIRPIRFNDLSACGYRAFKIKGVRAALDVVCAA
jgi:hypothetical protein